MFYVYSKYLKTGKEDFINTFKSAEDAVHHIAKCYRIDTQCGQLGDYYYFMKQR